MYPNPTSAKIRISFLSLTAHTYTIYSLLGQKMLSGVLERKNNEIDLSILGDGKYVLALQSKNHQEVLRTRLLVF